MTGISSRKQSHFITIDGLPSTKRRKKNNQITSLQILGVQNAIYSSEETTPLFRTRPELAQILAKNETYGQHKA